MQVEQLNQQHQIEEVSAVENSSQMQLQQVSGINIIADSIYDESQIGIEIQMKDDNDVEANVTQWQGLKQHDIVQQRQEQELTEIIKKSNAKIMADSRQRKITIFVMKQIEQEYRSTPIISILAGRSVMEGLRR